MATYKITLSAPSWTQTTAALYWDTVSQRFYTDTELTDAVTAIVPPTRECYRFSGFYDGPAGDATVQYINSDGSFTADFFAKAQTLTGALTITGLGTLVSLKVSFNQNGGTSEPFTLYYRVVGRGIYADSLCEGEQVTSVPKAVAVNKAFCGYYSSKTVDGEKYVTKDGGLTIALKDGNFTGDLTIYAVYQAPVKVTVSANGGTGGAASFYCDLVNDLWYATADVAAPPITSIALHAKECYRFVGCWSTNAMTGKMLVSPDGTISADWRLTANVTIYAQWEQVSYKVTIGKQSGTGGTDALYYSNGVANPNGWYKDDLCVEAVTSIALPSLAGFAPKGVFSATANGTQYISPDGTLLDAFAAWGATLTAAKTIYLQWAALLKITLAPASGTGGTAQMWYSPVDGRFFSGNLPEDEITSVTVPVRECFRFLGFFSAATNGTQYITPSGAFTQDLTDLAITAAKTFTAQWERVSWKLTLDPNGGTGGAAALYCGVGGATYYADDQATIPATAVDMPSLNGHAPLGFFAAKTANAVAKYIDGDGTIVAKVGITADTTVYAHWRTRTFTLTFDYNGGTGSVASKVVSFGQPIGALPEATAPKFSFVRWQIDGVTIGEDTLWSINDGATAKAEWVYAFSDITDFFGLATPALVPIASNSNDERPRVVVAHGGKYEAGVSEMGNSWRNPSVTYVVKSNTVVALRLGKAFPAVKSGGKMVRSGYMITAAEIVTEIGRFPTVTVSAVANEGVNAINNFVVNKNKFDVAVPVVARSRAQNLLGAISGGGHLQRMTLLAICDPVVCEENLMPCASDIVNGRYELRAETVAPSSESAPSADPDSGFALTSAPEARADVAYTRYSLTARKEMV